MTILCSCRNIKKDFVERTVLKDIQLDIREGERIGLVGRNGSGKTTLANILLGKIIPEEGSILWHQDKIKKGYLHQATFYTADVFKDMLVNSEGKEKLQGFFHTSSQMGLEKVQQWHGDRLDRLSGGEKTKLALAAIWAEKPTFLILDEPTNHLDYQGVQWLIDELKKYKGTVLIISHDRYFLDETVDTIIEIDEGMLQHYQGNYSFYREEKKRRYESQFHAYEVQERYKQKVAEEIKQLENWSAKAHRESRRKQIELGGKKEYYRVKAKKKDKQVKSKLKRLEKLEVEGIAKPKEEAKTHFAFQQADKRGKRILEAKDIKKSFDQRILFEDSSFYILRGDRVGLFGRNGCGKTTFVRTLRGEEALDSGHLYISPSVRIGYLSQDVLDLDEEQTVLEALRICTGEERSKVGTLLANMGFSNEILQSPIKVLSMGERTRIKIAGLIMENYDMLILDEPTNHLDLHAREKLEETLENYEGTILLVSHDRYMMEKLCDKLLTFENNGIKRVEYGLKAYLENKEKRSKGMASDHEQTKEEEKLIIENRITVILGELSKYDSKDPEYARLDLAFKELLAKKREWM
ncbi:MAG: ribosomal protection-like ABC-F family protein [Bacillota bacterium]